VTKEGVLVQSLTGRVLDMSERAAAILGVDASASVGRSIADLPIVLLNEQGLAMNPAAMLSHRTITARGGADDEDHPVLVGVARPGVAGTPPRMVQVSSQLVPAGDGESAALLTTLVDVTGSREVEAALTRSEMQFRVAMENAPIGMALVDVEWRIVEANAAFAELLGTSVGALRGYRMEDLSTPEGRPAERLEVDRLLGGGQHRFSLEKRYQRADGHQVWVALDAALVRTPAGAPDHFVVQVRDSTESRLQAEMLTHRAMHDSRLTYVEGYVFVYGVAIQHAWLVDADGFVIDPTLTDNDDGRVNGYFGVPFITEYVRKACRSNRMYGVLDYFYAGKTAPKLYELGLEAGQAWLLERPARRNRNRPTRKAVA